MKIGRLILNGLLLAAVAATLGAGVWLLLIRPPAGAARPAAPPIPAEVPKILKEDQINTITLTPAAIERLALKTEAVRKKAMPRSRVYGGEAMIPVGQVIVVSAPVGGLLKTPEGAAIQAGRTVKKGQLVFQLSPLVPPDAQATLTAAKIDAEGQVETTKSQLEGATIALNRARRLEQREAGSKRAVDEAQALYDVAKKAADAAVARSAVMRKVAAGIEKGNVAPVDIEAPDSGMVRNVSALTGQSVPAGAALFEVVNLQRVWVRVPVYVGDLPEVDAAADASVAGLTVRLNEKGRTAKPTVAPPSANAAAGTVDLFYEMDNRETKYSPGQRVGVRVALKGEKESLTVPWSAVILDIHGGTWVYEQTGARDFVRRRVVVRFVSGDTAVLAAGPPAGAKVVSAGAAELFGTETGFSK